MSDTEDTSLAARVARFRDEVLATEEPDERETSGAEVFDAVERALSGRRRPASPAPGSAVPSARAAELDLALHDAIARRLAWRDSELRVLSDAREVCRRLLAVAKRELRDPMEEMEVAEAVAEAGSAAARILIVLVLGRVARERAALLREELAQERLAQAIERQREELRRLEELAAQAGR